jgi:predicted DNA-binding helix-hairpin-helix protein
MDRYEKLAVLSEAATGDREHGLPSGTGKPDPAVGIRKVQLPGGGTTNIMRIMQTNACSLSCGYCPFHAGAKLKRVALAPEEVASTFMEANRKGLARGLFLTSGIPGKPTRMMDRMLAAVEILRRKEDFPGYVHLKVLPGAEPAQIERATQLANRISINLEGPGDGHVRRLAKEKDLSGDILPKLEMAGRLLWEAKRERSPDEVRPAGTTTQFVVGATGEADREILGLVARLERHQLLHHAHFSAFQPVAGTPMEGERAVPLLREFRLYQAEHLLRQYSFTFDELPFGQDGNLPLDQDPKTAWALRRPESFPLEVMTAPYQLLVRVPGIGPKTASTLLRERRHTLIRGSEDLNRMGVDSARAAYFLTLRGRRLATTPQPLQPRLFPYGEHLPRGPLHTATPPCAYR